jgi:ribosome production factor 2
MLEMHVQSASVCCLQIPRVQLEEAGPQLDLTLRRTRPAPPDLQKEALTHPKLGKKKQKNTGFEELEGKVGRIYMPAQDLSTVALAKGKGTKRVRRDAAAERKQRKVLDGSSAGAASAGSSGDDHFLALPS